MVHHDDHERRLGAVILFGLAAFALVALASFYFNQPERPLLSGLRDNIALTTR